MAYVKKNHQIVDEIIQRMITHGSFTKVKDALQPAIFAKNMRTNFLGFSPYQIVYGKNPRIPGAIENSLPAADGLTTSSLIQQRLTNIFNARRALAEVDSKHRLRIADKSHRTPKLEKYYQGEEVYYKFGLSPGWHGPGKVVAQDNKLVYIRHGQNIIVASMSRISKVKDHHSPPESVREEPLDGSKPSLEINKL